MSHLKQFILLVLLILVGVVGWFLLKNGSSVIQPTVNLIHSYFALPTLTQPQSSTSQKVDQSVTPSVAPPAPNSAPQVSPTADFTAPSYGQSKVRISYVTPSNSYQPATIGLYANLNGNETINLGGWKIKTKKGEVAIPQAVEVYDPSSPNTPQDIVLQSGGYVYLYSSYSQVGVNFRLNRCMGYLERLYQFKPSLPLSCPAIYSSRSEIIGLTNSCQDYITSLGTCGIPAANPPVPVNDSDCKDFLNQINYGGCLTEHRNDSDFSSREWRVFLGSAYNDRNILDPNHDRVQLLNRAGVVIDEYIY